MDVAAYPVKIRHMIRQTLVDLGGEADSAPQESLLIREGRYCGHRFRYDECQAVWFVEEDQVKFYGPRGRMVKLIRPSEYFAQKAA